MKNVKHVAIVALATVAFLTACSNNNSDAANNENDTNLVDTRRNTDTTSNYLTDDSTDANQTPTQEGRGLGNGNN